MFGDVAVDIVVSVFAMCDIGSVLATSQTCKRLHSIAFERSVWISLIQDLQSRQLMDLTQTPSLTTLRTSQLIGLVRRLVHGPLSWRDRTDEMDIISSQSFPSPALQNQIIIPLPAEQSRPGFHIYNRNEVQLLPDGTHLLCSNSGILECWNVAIKKRIWRHACVVSPGQADVVEFAATRAGPEVLRIVMGIRVPYLQTDMRLDCVEVVEVDLQTCISQILVSSQMTSPIPDNALRGAIIHGDFAAVVSTCVEHPGIYLLNLSVVEKPRMLHIACQETQVGLTDANLVLCSQEAGSRQFSLRVIPIASLENFWGPASPSSTPESLRACPSWIPERFPVISARMSLGPLVQRVEALTVLASPIRSNEYRIWVHAYSASGTGLLRMFRLVQASTTPGWTSFIHPGPVYENRNGTLLSLAKNITYSGHALSNGSAYTTQLAIPLSLLELDVPRDREESEADWRRAAPLTVVGLQSGGLFSRVSSYSGAVTYSTAKALYIKYYR
uniref:F-box domain-containing protein n=1 Tax=Mycena chlorophos TaxID=658473 RepID=A0ABQ0L435_MYCCL|nr:predicted protein [Mycena chlorophos]